MNKGTGIKFENPDDGRFSTRFIVPVMSKVTFPTFSDEILVDMIIRSLKFIDFLCLI